MRNVAAKTRPTKNVNRKTDHPHIWGTDELMQKLLDGVFASEAISS